MKVFLTALFLASASAHASCPDLSGTYSSPEDLADRKITHMIVQKGCESITVNSILQRNGVTTSHAVYSLDGKPAHDCLMDFFANCGVLKSTESGIEKIDPQFTLASDEAHGICTFEFTVLGKDAQGNLTETITAAKCEDGYTGALAPRIYPKK